MFNVSTCFGHYLPILRRHYTDTELVAIVCGCSCGLVPGHGKRPPHIYHCTQQPPILRSCNASWGWASNARNTPRHWTSIKWSESEVCIKLVVLLRNYSSLAELRIGVTGFILGSWTLSMGRTSCVETSGRNYQYSLNNIPEKRSSHIILAS
jgi:hypothetical protein